MHLTQNPGIHASISPLEFSTNQGRISARVLLQRLLDNFMDGILILTEKGDWIQANAIAQQICEQITQNKSQPNSVPQEIWRVCQFLIESRGLYPNHPVIIESEIKIYDSRIFRIRVQWFELKGNQPSYFLVILEDRYQSLQNLVLAEIEMYSLTPREAEVWSLYRANYTRKEIAAKLFICLDTVKKHLKNIKAKQEKFLYIRPFAKVDFYL